MSTDTLVLHGLIPRRLDAEDFETASIRSAAPSYVSEAPSYHTLPPSEAVPAYTPRTTTSTVTESPQVSAPSRQVSSMLPPVSESRSSIAPSIGLPPIPRRSESSSTPSLSQFHIPSWSSINSGNPQARHYQSVANRRVAAASAFSGPSSAVEGALRAALSRINAANADASEEDSRIRPLEDPYLVGEEAATRARNERLALKHGEDILIHEDRQWDSWLAQMRNGEVHTRSWNTFRPDFDRGNNRRRLTRRFGR
ncbi:hypothetical protein GGS24DRAFT_503374 [Hypoxylon argillaceum]|nr:hypothetical protein GGS24DRAFT_503374 [Hypoxylon argillaceum]KAI1154060.1 hypothetical protein F4825DRAFT_448851 [Nemania diffusa]